MASWGTLNTIPKGHIYYGPLYHVIGIGTGFTKEYGYHTTMIEADRAVEKARSDGKEPVVFEIHRKQGEKKMQFQNGLINIPADKQDGPLFVVVNANNAPYGVFDVEKEAENHAALLFSANAGKQPVYVFGLLKVAKPAVPKVEFTEAKKA